AVEHGAPGNYQVHAHGGDGPDVLASHAAVDSEHHRPAASLDQLPSGREAALGRRRKALASPARIDGQDQYELEVIEKRLHRRHRSTGVQCDSTLDRGPKCLQNAVRVSCRLDVEGEHVCTGFDVGADLLEGILDHQVDVL